MIKKKNILVLGVQNLLYQNHKNLIHLMFSFSFHLEKTYYIETATTKKQSSSTINVRMFEELHVFVVTAIIALPVPNEQE